MKTNKILIKLALATFVPFFLRGEDPAIKKESFPKETLVFEIPR